MIRTAYLQEIEQSFRTSPIVAVLGPRQCGKTTLARHYFRSQQGLSEHYFDLEDPLDWHRLQDPLLTLEHTMGLVVIDEVQLMPHLFPVLRVLVDKGIPQQRFLILGSASRQLFQKSSESLAGRIHYIELTPFSCQEVDLMDRLWLRGGFPLAYLADTEKDSAVWRKDYIRTYLEQDIPQLGIHIPAISLRRFWMMVTHYHGQLFNASELGNSLDLSHHTVKRYLDILTDTFMLRQLPPWYENIGKRQVKSVKIYFRDSGIYHTLLNINNHRELLIHPKLGASWEGFALESVIHTLSVDPADCYFWATHGQAELDLLIVQGMNRIGFEFKYTKAPKITKSMHISLETLQLNKLTIIYPGDKNFLLAPKIECVGLDAFCRTVLYNNY
ncbi:MAG: hypothetical protein A3F17_07705 [Gammaproteobacteria bacterium RIFCSPHIGHO2_12_FULL_41_15]|nr:MAG: hypothetical protein A3F17_07705 [Gammaproteobacteria bacterium RIFCSPHIGHO2_12_FULL_41_15]